MADPYGWYGDWWNRARRGAAARGRSLLDQMFPESTGGGSFGSDEEGDFSDEVGGGGDFAGVPAMEPAYHSRYSPYDRTRRASSRPAARSVGGGMGMPMFRGGGGGWGAPPIDANTYNLMRSASAGYGASMGRGMADLLPDMMASGSFGLAGMYPSLNRNVTAGWQKAGDASLGAKYFNARQELDKYKFDKMMGMMTPAIQSLAGVPSATADFQPGVAAKLARAPAMSAASSVYEKLLGALGIPATSAPTPITGFTGEGGMFANPSGVGTGIDTNAAAGIPGIVAEGLRGMRGVANQTMPYLRGPNTGYADYFKNVAMGVPVGKAAQLGRAGARTATGLSLASKGLNSAKMNELLDLLRLMYSGGLQSQSDLSDFGLRSLGGIQQSMMMG